MAWDLTAGVSEKLTYKRVDSVPYIIGYVRTYERMDMKYPGYFLAHRKFR